MKSVLVIGLGRFGLHLAEKMLELGNDVMVADCNEQTINEVGTEFTDAQIGDCTNENVLRSMGVKNFDVCFVCMGEDFQSSLEITSILKDLGVKHVVAKANSERQAALLKKIGADAIVYPEREIAEKLAVMYNANNILDYIPLTGDYSIYEIPVVKSWIGKAIIDINVRRKYKVNIIAIKNNSVLNPAPGGDYIFKSDDTAIVIGKSSDVFKLAGK